MLPSEYIAKYAKQKDFTSLEKLVDIYRYGGYEGQTWSYAHEVLTKPSRFSNMPDVFDLAFEFLAEIQFGEATVLKWRAQWQKQQGFLD